MEPEGSILHSQAPDSCTGCLPRSIQSMFPPPLPPPTDAVSWWSVLILSSHPRLGPQVVSFPHVSPSKPCMNLITIRSTCPVHFILLDLIIRIVFGEDCRLYSSSLRSLLHPPVTSSLLRPDIFSSPYSRTPSVCVPLAVWETSYEFSSCPITGLEYL